MLVATANPAELAGTHRLSEALRDRLRVWIPLGYPERSVELKIIRANLGGYVLDNGILERIYDIVYATRIREDMEQPASLRAGISIARLCGQHIRKYGKLTEADINEYARDVLLGASKPKIPQNAEKIIGEILK